MRLSDKVAFITGGTSGIGKATLHRLIKEGAKVVFTGRKVKAGKHIATETGAVFFQHNVTDADGYKKITQHIKSEFGRWNNLIGINLTGAMLTTQMAVNLMKENPDGATGSIIINSSMNGHMPLGNYVTYSTAKGAHIALGKSTAVHCATKGYKIRCNIIHPGVVETEMISGIIEGAEDSAAVRAQFEGMAALKRMGTVEEIAGLVTYLSSDEAAFISGASYNIDGATTAGMMGV